MWRGRPLQDGIPVAEDVAKASSRRMQFFKKIFNILSTNSIFLVMDPVSRILYCLPRSCGGWMCADPSLPQRRPFLCLHTGLRIENGGGASGLWAQVHDAVPPELVQPAGADLSVM